MLTWKNKKLQTSILLLLLNSSASFNQDINFNNSSVNISNNAEKENNLKEKDPTQIHINNLFHKFNPKFHESTSELFKKVADHYGLKVKGEYDYFISQLLTESGGKQFKSNGDVLMGKAGEVGMCQIKPSTALFFISKKFKQEDHTFMKEIGIDPVKNIKTVEQTESWLKETDNNIFMWGFIMNYNFKVVKNKVDSFVSYNTGLGGLKKLKEKGGHPINHEYFKRIHQIKTLINK